MNVLMGMPNKGLQGGPPGHLPFLVQGLEKLNINVIQTLYGSRTNVKTMGSRVSSVIESIISLRKILSKNDVDIIHLNSAFDLNSLLRDFTTLFFLRPFKAKKYIKFHGSEADLLQTKNWLYKLMIKKMSQWADGFGLLSSEEKNNFIRANFPPKKLFVVKNIIKPNVYLKNPQFRNKYSSEGVPILLFIARLIPSKGLIDTLQAAILLRKSGYIFKLIVLGDGPDKVRAEKIVGESDMTSMVFFEGYITEESTKPFYANCDLLIFPTYHFEGFSMVLFQSVAAGLSIITTKIRAAADYLKEPDNCLWVEPKNPEMLADKIAFILKNQELSGQMSNNNKALSKIFTEDIVCQEFAEIYANLRNN
jgi:glycosyltransferase involved in cell wall biosynthesis